MTSGDTEETRDAAAESHPEGDTNEASSGTGRRSQSLMTYLAENRSESALLVSRLITLYFCMHFVLPVFGTHPYIAYQRAMMASAVTSAIRLYQRIGSSFRFSREQLNLALAEDSCHYLIFSIVFIPSSPNTVAMLPVLMFALLQLTSQYRNLLKISGRTGPGLLNRLVEKLERNQRTIFRFIAMSEIMLMPIVVFMVFTGRVNIFVILIYYKFLTLRYASRRNKYSRTTFYELRISLHHLSTKPQCPIFVRNLIFKGIDLVSRLAPPGAPTSLAY